MGREAVSWVYSILIGVLTAAFGAAVGGFVADHAVRWLRVSNFEGGAGYAVIMWALLALIVGLLYQLVARPAPHGAGRLSPLLTPIAFLVLAEQMSSAFRANEAKTRVMVDIITDHAIFTLDVQRRVTSWNTGSERMLGFTEAEILGQPVSAFLPEADRDDDT